MGDSLNASALVKAPESKTIFLNPLKRLEARRHEIGRDEAGEIVAERQQYSRNRGSIYLKKSSQFGKRCDALRKESRRDFQKTQEISSVEKGARANLDADATEVASSTLPPDGASLDASRRPLESNESVLSSDATNKKTEIWQEMIIETHEDVPTSVLIHQRAMDPIKVHTTILRQFSDLIACEPADITVFSVNVNCLDKDTNSLVRQFLYGEPMNIDSLDFFKKVDLGIAVEYLGIRALSFLVLCSLHDDMISGYTCPDRDMMIHVYSHCAEKSALKDLMVGALYLWLVVFEVDESTWRKDQPTNSWECDEDMWLSEFCDKVQRSIDTSKTTPSASKTGSTTASEAVARCSIDTLRQRSDICMWLQDVRQLRALSAIQDASFFDFFEDNGARAKLHASMSQYLSRTSEWVGAMPLPCRRPVAPMEVATNQKSLPPTASPPAQSIKLNLKRKATGDATPAPPKKPRRDVKGGSDTTASASSRRVNVFEDLEEDSSPPRVLSKPISSLAGNYIELKCSGADDSGGVVRIDRKLAITFSKDIADKLKRNPRAVAFAYPNVPIASMQKLVSCMEKGIGSLFKENWLLEDVVITACAAECLATGPIAEKLFDRIRYHWSPTKRVSFRMANLVYAHTRKVSKLRRFVREAIHWVLLKNKLNGKDKMLAECERHLAADMYEDLLAMNEKFGDEKQGKHPAKLRDWELDECLHAGADGGAAKENGKAGSEQKQSDKTAVCECLSEMLGVEAL